MIKKKVYCVDCTNFHRYDCKGPCCIVETGRQSENYIYGWKKETVKFFVKDEKFPNEYGLCNSYSPSLLKKFSNWISLIREK